MTSSVTRSVCFLMFWHNHALPASRRFESEACRGGYCLVTKKYWVFFTYGPCEWTGHDVRGTPAETLHAWKVPGDLWDPEKQVYVEKVLNGSSTPLAFIPTTRGSGKEKLKCSFRGWSKDEHCLYLRDHKFVRGLFAETGGEPWA